MAIKIINMPRRQMPELANTQVELPPPNPLPEPKKGPLIMRLMPLIMVAMIVAMVAMMIATGAFSSGGGMSWRILMMPMMAMFMAMAYLGTGGHGGGPMTDIDGERNTYQLKLGEQRRVAHYLAEGIHLLHTATYPHPQTIAARIARPGMWGIRPSDNKLPPGVKEEDSPEALRAWLTARVGVGVTNLLPRIEEPPTEIASRLEPVTAGAYSRFLRTQKFITNCPLGISFAEQNAYSFRGDQTAVLGLGRALICSLAFNHIPTDLAVGIICEPASQSRWEWIKWLPNNQDRNRSDRAGSARYAWASLAEFLADAELATGEGQPHLVVFIDTPSADVILPAGWSRPGVTLVVLAAASESISTRAGRFHVAADRQFSTARQLRFAHADAISTTQARIIAQKMSQYRPPNWSQNTGETDDAEVTQTKRTYFDVLDIDDVEVWDPRPRWQANSKNSNFEVPIGFVVDEHNVVGSEVFRMDFGEAAVDGTGPHGVVQGKTGFGKSFFLMNLVLNLCAEFPATKVNLILMDFKGGSTFLGFEKLPHVTALISNLDNAGDLVERTAAVINGEIHRRETLLVEKYGVKDIVEYRKLQQRHPDKYTDILPDLFVIMDEFKEYMEAHPDQNKTYVRIGTVGRAWGIHVIPTSQKINEALVRDLGTNLTFGISFRAPDPGHSRYVIKSEAAATLPKTIGIAYREVRRDPEDPERVRFQAFNVEQRYVAPSRRRTAGPQRPGNAGAAARGRMCEFTLTNSFAGKEDTVATVADGIGELSQRELDELPQMKEALIGRIAQFDEYKALPLWQPTLRAPITYADVTIETASSPRLAFQIGLTDAPFEHARLPYVLHPEDSGAHIRIVGQAGSGRSTAIQAIAAAAAQAYPARYCSFYLIDYAGAKLSEIRDLPNVGGYARKTDEDAINRFIGECFRVLAIREREFGHRGVVNLDDYFASRADNPVEGDPYGHIFLVFDGFTSYLADNEAAKDSLGRLLEGGARYGLHMIVTVLANAEIPVKMQRHFGTAVHLAVQDPNETNLTGATKQLVMRIPGDQPGRCVDLSRNLEARILVPQFEPINPTGIVRGLATYDYRANHAAGISRFVQEINARYPQADEHAVPINPAPPQIDYQIIWNLYDEYAQTTMAASPTSPERRFSLDKHLPFAISTEDLRVINVPDHTSPHLLALGDTQSGKTTLLRALLNSIVQTYTAEQAQIVIIESQLKLLGEQQQLDEAGYLMAYADKTTLPAAIEKVKAAIEPRFPNMQEGAKLSAAAMRNRSWYSGPEVFVLIDGVLSFTGGAFGMGGPVDPLLELMSRPDLGLHVYATGAAQGFSGQRQTNKLYKAFGEANTPTLLLSGPVAEGTLWPGSGIKFALRRPGQAALVDPIDMTPEVIQIGLARPWDDDDPTA